MAFPNPVPRPSHERKPSRRRRKRWIAPGIGVAVLLTTLFLPKLLGTKVGRVIVRQYLAMRFHAEASVGAFHTGWSGPTSAEQCWITMPDGRKIGFVSMQSDIGLMKLLRGRFDWGNIKLDGLYTDYLINDGHNGSTALALGAKPTLPGAVEMLPKFSGNFTLTRGTLVLWRGVVDGPRLSTEMRSVRFLNLAGTVNIASLDTEWKFDLSADTTAASVATASVPIGSAPVKVAGSAVLGSSGQYSPAQAWCHLKAEGEHQPLGALGAVTFKLYPRADWIRMLGEDGKVAMDFNGEAGHLDFNAKIHSDAANVELEPRIDLTVTPAVLRLVQEPYPTISSATLPFKEDASFGCTPAMCRDLLVYFYPLLANVANDPTRAMGQVKLTEFDLEAPLDMAQLRQGTGVTARGSVSLIAIPLQAPDARPDPAARTLVTDLCLLLGIYEAPTLTAQSLGFSIKNQTILADTIRFPSMTPTPDAGPMAMEIDTVGKLQGAGSIDAKLKLHLDTFGQVTAHVTGPPTSPRLQLLPLTQSLPDNGGETLMGLVEDHAMEMRRRSTEKAVKARGD